ncbi:hypothetical protein DPMN_004303 [Dreissena polymorpha]|uniref:Uncharacterized protein n=1 Tax=Dreissena polymorpha TaxID=45954 RepID=A0A9D4MRD3_DREPO|nr:hypothetical protein DPMN_004303 [Dreissena polymorpha]
MQVLLNDGSSVEDLFHFAPPCSESSFSSASSFLALLFNQVRMLRIMTCLGRLTWQLEV